MKHKCVELKTSSGVSLYHTGPALDHGPLPSIFYFALSGSDSLCKDPYNQPIQFLANEWIRFFSLTLPAHENDLEPTKAIGTWAHDMAQGIDVLGPFFDRAIHAIEYAIGQKFVDPAKMGIAGLSRGGLIASHLAAREKRFRAILQYAPITDLSLAREFHEMKHHPLLDALSLNPIAKDLADRPIRLYIGNKDTRVSTKSCFDFAMQLVAASSHRSPPIDFISYPSIGLMGHGTPPEIFAQGAQWLAAQIK